MAMRMIVAAAAAAGLLLATHANNARAHDEPVKGSLVGAGIGAAIGGPPGAAVGAVIGAAIGSTIAHETDHGHAARRDERHFSRARIERPVVERSTYVAPARFVESARYVEARPVRTRYLAVSEQSQYVPAARHAVHANGASAPCEPQKPVRKVAAKPKVKKVCRYVALR